MNEKLSRRKFLKDNILSSFSFITEIMFASIEQERNFIRPPGADDELLFLATCTRCGKCNDVCPTNTLRLFTVEAGTKLAGTPFLSVNEQHCLFCKECIIACPTNALTNNEAFKKIGDAIISESKCLAFKGIDCDYCVRTCPLGKEAINLVSGKPVVDNSICNGCGQCVSACIETEKAIWINPLER